MTLRRYSIIIPPFLARKIDGEGCDGGTAAAVVAMAAAAAAAAAMMDRDRMSVNDSPRLIDMAHTKALSCGRP